MACLGSFQERLGRLNMARLHIKIHVGIEQQELSGYKVCPTGAALPKVADCARGENRLEMEQNYEP